MDERCELCGGGPDERLGAIEKSGNVYAHKACADQLTYDRAQDDEANRDRDD